MSRSIRLIVATGLLATTLPSGIAAAADAPLATTPAEGAAGWLAGELVADGGAFTDVGLTLDSILALDAVGVAQDVAADALAQITSEVSAYVAPDDVVSAGRAAKTLLAVNAQGGDINAVDGRDLDADLRGEIQPDGTIGTGPIAGPFSHALSMMALAATPGGVPADVTTALIDQACTDGGFTFAYGDCTESSPDTTSLAIHALLADGGDDALAAVADAVTALIDVQGADGNIETSFGSNANTTGLAAWALAGAGETGRAAFARGAVGNLVVPCASVDETARGAIAYNADDLAAAIDADLGARDPYRRATAQGLLAFTAAGLQDITSVGAVAETPGVPCGTDGYCLDDAGVGVVVDLGELAPTRSLDVSCVPYTDGMTAEDALRRSTVAPRFSNTLDFGNALCDIEGLPEIEGCFDVAGYHAFQLGTRLGDWTFAPVGAGTHEPMAGEVMGFAWDPNFLDADTPLPGVDPSALAAAAWLPSGLTDGDHVETDFGVSLGGTIDVGLALVATDTETDTLDAIIAYLTTPANVAAYVGDADNARASAAAKLGLLVVATGGDPTDVGGIDLVARVTGAEGDDGIYHDFPSDADFTSPFSQALAVMFLGGAADVAASDAAVQAILDAQCTDGGFTFGFDPEGCAGNVDTTGIVLQGLAATARLVDARAAAIDDAVAFLDADRAADGSHDGNPNSTGLAASGLLAVGRDASAQIVWLEGHQSDDGRLATTSEFGNDVGATAQAVPALARASYATFVDTVALARVAGETRYETAIAASASRFADGAADTVVLSRGDVFADALAGTPVAASANGPLLLTESKGLRPEVLDEIKRVLTAGKTVHLLGGFVALDESIDGALEAAGYEVVRISGDDRYATSVAIAEFLGNPELQFLTTGRNFPDAMAAGAAAAAGGGAVLLTDDATPVPSVTAWLTANPGTQYAVGGPSAAAYPDATPLVGETRNDTAVKVAEEFFPDPAFVGIARNDDFADALAGGVDAATRGGPLLLTTQGNPAICVDFADKPGECSDAQVIPVSTAAHLCSIRAGLAEVRIYGGPNAVAERMADDIARIIDGADCA